MTRQTATELLRKSLDENSLSDWHIRLTMDVLVPYLGMCSYKDKTVILNAHHIDQHPDEEVRNTILHEAAHALTPGAGHNETWASKARALGCDNTSPCATYALSPDAIDSIRSGATVKIEFTTEVIPEQIIRTPKHVISRLQDKCEVCGKVAKVRSRQEVKTSAGHKVVITYECNHIVFRDADSTSPFENIRFDGNASCQHQFNKTICALCGAKRLFPYQIAGARALERANGRLAIFDEMGLGKTIQALAYLKFHKKDAWPFLWVTKNGIKFQHAREIIRVLGRNAFPQIIMTGKDTLIPGMNVLCGYDIFRRLDLKMFEEHKFGAVILDECQAIKNPDSTRTQSVRAAVKLIPRIIPLSGTPWKNRGSEFFVVLNMLDPKRFWSYEGFKKQWVRYYWEGSKQKEGGINNPTKFKEFISDLAIRRERTEVMPELPLINRTRFNAEIPEFARKAYKTEEDNLISIYNDAVIGGDEDSFGAQAKMMQYLIVMRQIIGIAKVPATVEFAKEFLEDTDRKLVIFVHHKECGIQIRAQLTEWCKEENLPEPLALTADLDSAARFAVQEKFNSPNYRVLIASTLASGEGLNLQTCSDCIMHERQWNPANEEQAEGRFIRIGQLAQSVNTTYVHGDDTIDPTLDAIVERKRVEFHNAMNRGQMAIWNEGGIIKELIAAIAAKKRK